MVLIDRMRLRQGRWSSSSRCRSGVPTPGTRSPGPVENTTGRRNGLRVGQVADHPFHLLPGLHPNGDPLATGHARLETRRLGPTDS